MYSPPVQINFVYADVPFVYSTYFYSKSNNVSKLDDLDNYLPEYAVMATLSLSHEKSLRQNHLLLLNYFPAILNQVLTNLFFLNRSFLGILVAAVIQPVVQQRLNVYALRI